MTWADVFYRLWQADWSATQIAEAYNVSEERVRIVVASYFAQFLPEDEAA